jgi:tRNA A-37 threonylcarbamoyl transferase component Bud32
MSSIEFEKILKVEFPQIVIQNEKTISNERGALFFAEIDNIKVVIKCRNTNNLISKSLAEREFLTLEAFMRNKPEFNTPEIFAVDINRKFSVSEYINGTCLGNLRYFDSNLQIDTLNSVLHQLQQIPTYTQYNQLGISALKSRYIERWEEYIKMNLLEKQDLENLLHVFNTKNLICHFQHGDPSATNWINSSEGLFIIDWELASEYLPLYDIAATWCFCINLPIAQKQIFQHISTVQKDMIIFFILNIIITCVREIKIISQTNTLFDDKDNYVNRNMALSRFESALQVARKDLLGLIKL